MDLQNCPRCMQKTEGSKCSHCGFDAKEYKAPPNALPAGTAIGNCIIGIALAASRQSICYSAMDSVSNELVLLEELFPSAAVKREGKDVVQGRADARFHEAAEWFADAKDTERNARLIAVFRENNTVYREYAVDPSDACAPEKSADALLDAPIRFRDKNGVPLYAINTLPILPLPVKREIKEKSSGKGRKWLIVTAAVLILALIGIIAAWKLG